MRGHFKEWYELVRDTRAKRLKTGVKQSSGVSVTILF
jgi:hypothetical protein